MAGEEGREDPPEFVALRLVPFPIVWLLLLLSFILHPSLDPDELNDEFSLFDQRSVLILSLTECGGDEKAVDGDEDCRDEGEEDEETSDWIDGGDGFD